MGRLVKFLRLPWSDRKVLLKAVALLWAVRIGLWCLPFQQLRALLIRKSSNLRDDSAQFDRIETIANSVRVMSRYVPMATCLVQALVTVALLEQEGLPGSLRIGVARRSAAKIEAHAWVESNGAVVIGGADSDLSRFTVLHTVEGI